ncbi:pyridoxamine 5'-phosphate oxidase family protein [Neptunicella sp.]|uniref:pyridoxamine 5'-phosphate oxidase family protein n=1 Tax=Neptunicella sp. TaxID=2125986 RepID=UPI003F691A53
MGQQFNQISTKLTQFIQAQKIFFVATATADSRVNLSPKGMDSLRVLSPNRVIWLNVTGSGNETACHVQENPRMTIMFTAFEGAPMILRLYGQARVIHQHDSEWHELFGLFPAIPGARQIFDLQVDLVQTSCGMAVPFFDYVEEREQLKDWANKQGEEGIKSYWQKKNQHSIDGKPTHILHDSE